MPSSPIPSSAASNRFFPWLLLLFAGTGCAALIYEVVWYQLLQLVIGSTTVSLGVLLAVFMGGLCLGSAGYPRLDAPRRRHPLAIYALIEILTGASALLVLLLVPLVDHVYIAAVGFGLPAILLRSLLAGLCLLPPTLLMGASLPALSRWIKATSRGASSLGWLYAANTAGAVLGCLAAGFYLLPRFSMREATLLAAALNCAIGAIAYAASLRLPAQLPELEPSTPATATSTPRNATPAPPPAPTSAPIYIAIALSGLTALGAEVVWTRLLSLLLGPTVYTFAIILAVFLLGLALGSGAGAALVRTCNASPSDSPSWAALGWSQALLAAAIAWSAYMVSASLPFWPVNPLLSQSTWMTFQLDLAHALWAILPPALLWGASFPLALAAAPAPHGDSGLLVGRLYASNTAGAIVGALAFSIILVPAIGSRNSQRLLILLALLSALTVLLPLLWRHRSRARALQLLAASAASLALAASVPPVPGALIAFGRRIMTSLGHGTILATAEGRNSSIAYTRWEDGAIQFAVAGKAEASTEPYDMRLQRSLGNLPALLHPDPRSVLVVGFGAGVTAGSFVLYPDLQHLDICEIEPLIPRYSTLYFGPQNYDVLNDPRTHMVYDDARAFVPSTHEKFDIITSDPIHPWVRGSASLYTREYFAAVKAHLNPGGLVTQWVPLYETNAASVRSEIATFFQVFPDGTLWANNINGQGYDVFLMGSTGPLHIDIDQLQARLDQPPYARVAASLQEVGFNSSLDLLATYAGNAQGLNSWLAGAAINRDSNLRLQYLAGLSLNEENEGDIYSQIVAYRTFSTELFQGSPASLQALAARLPSAPPSVP